MFYQDSRVNFEGDEHYAYKGVNALDTFGGIYGRAHGSKLTITNSYNTGNLTMYSIYIGGIIGKANNGTNIIENCYNAGNITSSSFTGGIVGYYKGTINKSYNTGNLTIFSGDGSGGIIAQGEANTSALITNSYNEGDITVTTFGSENQVGGLCGMSCSITNSYNRGDLDFKHQPWSVGGIIGAAAGNISNVYNSGTITIENIVQSSARQLNTIYLGGINGQSSTVSNAYNLGDINAYYNGTNNLGFGIAGVSYGEASNSVNTGNITLAINQPYTAQRSFYLGGISLWSNATNNFNAGTITLDDSALGHSIYDEEFTNTYGDTYKHSIYIGEINANYTSESSGNRYNTDPNNKPFYCTSDFWYCTQEKLDAVGTYTTESTPSILSIINGDNAFNDELDEDGLPTLRVFN